MESQWVDLRCQCATWRMFLWWVRDAMGLGVHGNHVLPADSFHMTGHEDIHHWTCLAINISAVWHDNIVQNRNEHHHNLCYHDNFPAPAICNLQALLIDGLIARLLVYLEMHGNTNETGYHPSWQTAVTEPECSWLFDHCWANHVSLSTWW